MNLSSMYWVLNTRWCFMAICKWMFFLLLYISWFLGTRNASCSMSPPISPVTLSSGMSSTDPPSMEYVPKPAEADDMISFLKDMSDEDYDDTSLFNLGMFSFAVVEIWTTEACKNGYEFLILDGRNLEYRFVCYNKDGNYSSKQQTTTTDSHRIYAYTWLSSARFKAQWAWPGSLSPI